MLPQENAILARLEQKVDDMKEDMTEIKEVVPLVYKHGEAIRSLEKSQTWIKRIMLTFFTVSGLGAVVAKFWPGGN